jgi:hypothetical protein
MTRDPQSAPLLDENRRLCSTEIGTSARRNSAHLLDGNRLLCSTEIGTSAQRKSAPLLANNRPLCLPEKIGASPRSTHSSQISFSSILLLRQTLISGEVGGHAGSQRRSERERERLKWGDGERKKKI